MPAHTKIASRFNRTLFSSALILVAACAEQNDSQETEPAARPDQQGIEMLLGKEWMIEDINQGGIIDSSRLTLNFTAEAAEGDQEMGWVTGRASCNQYQARYRQATELHISQLVLTEKACAPALMLQEQRFSELLPKLRHYEINAVGALILSTEAGETLRAFPAKVIN